MLTNGQEGSPTSVSEKRTRKYLHAPSKDFGGFNLEVTARTDFLPTGILSFLSVLFPVLVLARHIQVSSRNTLQYARSTPYFF